MQEMKRQFEKKYLINHDRFFDVFEYYVKTDEMCYVDIMKIFRGWHR